MPALLIAWYIFAATLRPGYHYTRPRFWMNDAIPDYDATTNIFHLFMVCDPNSTSAPWSGGLQAWCHATSSDMATEWTTQPIAIPPEASGTGSAISLPIGSVARKQLQNASAAIVTASGVAPWTTTLWASSDTMRVHWRKVALLKLPTPSNVSGLVGSGDVRLWYDVRRVAWRLLVSGLTTGGEPPVLLHYESSAGLLSGWHYTGVLYTHTAGGANRMECPSYTSFSDGSAILMFSWPHRGYAQFWVSGTEDPRSGTFAPKRSGQLEYGVGYAAAMTTSWPGRVLLYSWMRGVSDGRSYVGAQSLPREVRLQTNGDVTLEPVTELTKLLKQPSVVESDVSVSGKASFLAGRVPQQACLRVRVDATGDTLPASLGLSLVNDGLVEGANEQGLLQDDQANTNSLEVRVSVTPSGACVSLPHSGCAPFNGLIKANGTWELTMNATLWLDNALTEIYVNGGEALASAFTPAIMGNNTLNCSVWVTKGATAIFAVEWNEVDSARFTPPDPSHDPSLHSTQSHN